MSIPIIEQINLDGELQTYKNELHKVVDKSNYIIGCDISSQSTAEALNAKANAINALFNISAYTKI